MGSIESSELRDPSLSRPHAQNERTDDAVFDLVCVGFGPASLAIAVALYDLSISAKVLFLERQPHFAWHAGMLLPGARMQISFLKDLATFRDPRSSFTFLNYLKCQNRLEAFTNLGTFLPLREEFNDYLAWAAGHFKDQVRYSASVTSVCPAGPSDQPVDLWNIQYEDQACNHVNTVVAHHVVVAVGGTPRLPPSLQGFGSKVIHSSQYLSCVPDSLPSDPAATRIAVIGGGQSAAEIFDDLTSRFPQAAVTLYTTGSALRPSDDSPFVNEIFDQRSVSPFYGLSADDRRGVIAENKSTNYSVVRLSLLERLYEKLYNQRLHYLDEESWPHKIIGLSELRGIKSGSDGRLVLELLNPRSHENSQVRGIDLVVVGIGYTRHTHEEMLQGVSHLLQGSPSDVERDYKIRMREGAVNKDCGIWLQGCCETSHGLSDTLLSILATRAGELVQSIFGSQVASLTPCSGRKNKFH